MNHDESLTPNTRLVKALSAGAVVTFRPNLIDRLARYKEISEAYQELKGMIAVEYPQVEVDMLDIAPGSTGRKEALAEQLEAAGATTDERILDQAQTVLDIIAEEDPEALWAAEPADPAPQHK